MGKDSEFAEKEKDDSSVNYLSSSWSLHFINCDVHVTNYIENEQTTMKRTKGAKWDEWIYEKGNGVRAGFFVLFLLPYMDIYIRYKSYWLLLLCGFFSQMSF